MADRDPAQQQRLLQCYYVYDDQQLEQALEAFANRRIREGVATPEAAEQLKAAVRALHGSKEFAARGMRRGGIGAPINLPGSHR